MKDLPRERFGDNDKMANELGNLVLRGIKTATCSAYTTKEPVTKVGDQTIIENSKGNSLCVIETTELRIIPFNQVDSSFAFDEGEGDRSLEYWRQEHQGFFERDGGFSPDMLLLCERFKVIHKF